MGHPVAIYSLEPHARFDARVRVMYHGAHKDAEEGPFARLEKVLWAQ